LSTDTNRLTTLLSQIRTPLISPCPFVNCALMVLDEYEQTPDVAGMRKALDAMATSLRDACREYNNLRAHAGRWEAEQGVASPTFYPGEFRETGFPIGNCNCGLAPSRCGNVPHLPTGRGDLDAYDGQRTQGAKDDGCKSGVADVCDDLHAPIIGDSGAKDKE